MFCYFGTCCIYVLRKCVYFQMNKSWEKFTVLGNVVWCFKFDFKVMRYHIVHKNYDSEKNIQPILYLYNIALIFYS